MMPTAFGSDSLLLTVCAIQRVRECTFEIGDLGVTEPLFSQELTAVTERTQNLYNLLRELCTHIPRFDFAHRGLEGSRLFIIRQPDCLDDHQPGVFKDNV